MSSRKREIFKIFILGREGDNGVHGKYSRNEKLTPRCLKEGNWEEGSGALCELNLLVTGNC